MINRIFQFSDIPLTIANQAIFYSQDTQWAGEVGNYLHTTRRYANNHRYIHQPTTLTFSGDLIFDGNRLPAHLEQKLRSYVGFPDTLICYVLPNDYPPQFDMCQPCDTCCECEIMWITAPAILTDVSVDKSDFDGGFKISLTFSLLDFFIALNPLVWIYNGSIGYEVPDGALGLDAISSIILGQPNCDKLFTDCISCRFFSRANYTYVGGEDIDSQFSTTTWGIFGNSAYCDVVNYVKVQDPFETDVPIPTIIPEYTFSPIFIDPDKWGAPPLSYYALTFYDETLTNGTALNISGTSDQYIELRNTYFDVGIYRTEITKIDLIDLESQLTALGVTLRSGDTLYFGNINFYDDNTEEFYRPAFFLRGDTNDGYELTTIIPIHPKIIYPSFAPGQIYPTKNTLSIKYNSAWVNTDYIIYLDRIHWFRRV